MKSLIYGNLTIDQNSLPGTKYQYSGGAAFYIAKTLSNLRVKNLIISPYGPDFDKKSLSQTTFFPDTSSVKKTLVFENVYSGQNNRLQKVKNREEAVLPKAKDLSNNIYRNISLLFVAPVLNNITDENLFKLVRSVPKNCLKILLSQGFFRKIEQGKVKQITCHQNDSSFTAFDIIVSSENECSEIESLSSRWGRKSIAIVTRAEKDASIYFQGRRKDYPAFKVKKVIDETGAGDIFAAAFAFNFLKTKNIEQSVYFAHAAAALSLPLLPDKLKYSYRDIKSYDVRHRLT